MLTGSGRRLFAILALLAIVAAFPAAASASHSWGSYHWARTSNPFTLKLGDNVNGVWDPYLATTSSDWTVSSVLDTTIVAGSAKPRNCRPTSGRVEVCNASYGNNGWLGVASIWASGSHIAQGTVKVNDYYFNQSYYNTTAWRNLVMCQEVGHTFGLDHQDEAFDNTNLGTCMDYTSDPDGAGNGTSTDNQHPNQHDYDQLATIYSHLDSTTTVGQIATSGSAAPGWGRMIRDNGHTALFANDLGNGMVLFSFVIWAR